jgi:hypothetical protein
MIVLKADKSAYIFNQGRVDVFRKRGVRSDDGLDIAVAGLRMGCLDEGELFFMSNLFSKYTGWGVRWLDDGEYDNVVKELSGDGYLRIGMVKGGAGSGYWAPYHRGRPGMRGGSLPMGMIREGEGLSTIRIAGIQVAEGVPTRKAGKIWGGKYNLGEGKSLKVMTNLDLDLLRQGKVPIPSENSRICLLFSNENTGEKLGVVMFPSSILKQSGRAPVQFFIASESAWKNAASLVDRYQNPKPESVIDLPDHVIEKMMLKRLADIMMRPSQFDIGRYHWDFAWLHDGTSKTGGIGAGKDYVNFASMDASKVKVEYVNSEAKKYGIIGEAIVKRSINLLAFGILNRMPTQIGKEFSKVKVEFVNGVGYECDKDTLRIGVNGMFDGFDVARGIFAYWYKNFAPADFKEKWDSVYDKVMREIIEKVGLDRAEDIRLAIRGEERPSEAERLPGPYHGGLGSIEEVADGLFKITHDIAVSMVKGRDYSDLGFKKVEMGGYEFWYRNDEETKAGVFSNLAAEFQLGKQFGDGELVSFREFMLNAVVGGKKLYVDVPKMMDVTQITGRMSKDAETMVEDEAHTQAVAEAQTSLALEANPFDSEIGIDGIVGKKIVRDTALIVVVNGEKFVNGKSVGKISDAELKKLRKEADIKWKKGGRECFYFYSRAKRGEAIFGLPGEEEEEKSLRMNFQKDVSEDELSELGLDGLPKPPVKFGFPPDIFEEEISVFIDSDDKLSELVDIVNGLVKEFNDVFKLGSAVNDYWWVIKPAQRIAILEGNEDMWNKLMGFIKKKASEEPDEGLIPGRGAYKDDKSWRSGSLYQISSKLVKFVLGLIYWRYVNVMIKFDEVEEFTREVE